MTRIVVPLAPPAPEHLLARAEEARRAGADIVELRLDLALAAGGRADELLPAIARAPLPVLVTIRHAGEGGAWQGDEEERLRLYGRADALGAAWIDREWAWHARRPWLPARAGLVLSHHDWSGPGRDLPQLVRAMRAAGAAVAKVAVMARDAADLEAVRALHDGAGAGEVAAMAMGEAGLPSRLLAGAWGAAFVYARLADEAGTAPGQPTVEELLGSYRLRAQRRGTAVYGVIGAPIAHSRSPLVHNLAFAHHGLDAVYVPFLVHDATAFWRAARGWLAGLSITLPHKEALLTAADELEAEARAIGAINTLYRRDGRWVGANTDAEAIADGCASLLNGLRGRRALVLGAGGAARAAVQALRRGGAEVTVANRTAARAAALAREFGVRAVPWEEAPGVAFDLLLNATSVGLRDPEATPWPHPLPAGGAVFETIYDPLDTALLRAARRAGCRTASGLDMFISQAAGQFRRWTGLPAPVAAMRAACLASLQAASAQGVEGPREAHIHRGHP